MEKEISLGEKFEEVEKRLEKLESEVFGEDEEEEELDSEEEEE